MKTVYVIRHKPTGDYMPCRMFRSRNGGWSFWWPGQPGEGWFGCDGFDKNPRIFFEKIGAQRAVTAWLQGVHRRVISNSFDWEGTPDNSDDHIIDAPPFERKREDLEILELTLSGLV